MTSAHQTLWNPGFTRVPTRALVITQEPSNATGGHRQLSARPHGLPCLGHGCFSTLLPSGHRTAQPGGRRHTSSGPKRPWTPDSVCFQREERRQNRSLEARAPGSANLSPSHPGHPAWPAGTVCGPVARTGEKRTSREPRQRCRSHARGRGTRNLLCLALLPGQRHPAGHEAGVPGEPQADQQEEAEQDVGLGEGERPQLPVLLPQQLIHGLLVMPALQPAAPGRLKTGGAETEGGEAGRPVRQRCLSPTAALPCRPSPAGRRAGKSLLGVPSAWPRASPEPEGAPREPVATATTVRPAGPPPEVLA